jgi:hypothetical protein
MGIPRRKDKDDHLKDTITGLGCLLTNGPARVEPLPSRVAEALAGTLDLLRTKRASPLGVAALLGVDQWMAQMARGSFSVFDKVYAFVRLEPGKEVCDVPQDVLHELLVFALLIPLLAADLERPLSPVLMACDAAPEYGFGVSTTDLTHEEAADLAAYAE